MSNFMISAQFHIAERDENVSNSILTDAELDVFREYLNHIWELFNCVNVVNVNCVNIEIVETNILQLNSTIMTEETAEAIQIYLEVLSEKSLYQADLHDNFYFHSITNILILQI